MGIAAGTGCSDLRPTHRATAEENALAAEKERLAQQLQQLQQGLQQQEPSLAEASPESANKVRRALSNAEQKELALRMQKNAQWIREGYGDRNLEMEDNVTAGLEQLSRDLRGAQQALDNSNANGKNGSDATAKALSQVRQLRQQLERAQQSGQRRRNPGSRAAKAVQAGIRAICNKPSTSYPPCAAKSPAKTGRSATTSAALSVICVT